MTKKRIIIILFIMVFIFLIKQTQSIEGPLQEGSGWSNKIEYAAEGLKDPFQEEKIEIKEEPEAQVEKKPLPQVQIQGIVWGGAFPQAIINNKVVKIGETIGQIQVTDITKRGVTVLFENRKYNLSIPSVSTPKSPNPEGGKDAKPF